MSVETFVWRYSEDPAPFPTQGRPLSYRGPRFEGIVVGMSEAGDVSRAAGPGIGNGVLEWGADGGDLERGVPARLGDVELRLHRPRWGLARSARAIRIDGDPAGPLLLRLRAWKRPTLERGDGAPLVSYGFKGRIYPAAEPRHVALLLLAHVTRLDRLLEARLEQLGFLPTP